MDKEVHSNVKKRGFYFGALQLMRRPEDGVIIEPFVGTGRGTITAETDFIHLCCDEDSKRIAVTKKKYPKYKYHVGDNVPWLRRVLKLDGVDVIAVDFDAQARPWEALDAFLQVYPCDQACLIFVTWGYRNFQKDLSRKTMWRKCRASVAALCKKYDKESKAIGHDFPDLTVGGTPHVLYSAFSVVKVDGKHLDKVLDEEEEFQLSDTVTIKGEAYEQSRCHMILDTETERQCMAPAVKGTEFCHSHGPHGKEWRTKGAKMGGAANKKFWQERKKRAAQVKGAETWKGYKTLLLAQIAEEYNSPRLNKVALAQWFRRLEKVLQAEDERGGVQNVAVTIYNPGDLPVEVLDE